MEKPITEGINYQKDKKLINDLTLVMSEILANIPNLQKQLPPIIREQRVCFLDKDNRVIFINGESTQEYLRTLFHRDNIPILDKFFSGAFKALDMVVKKHLNMKVTTTTSTQEVNNFFDGRKVIHENMSTLLSIFVCNAHFDLNSSLSRTYVNLQNQQKEILEYEAILKIGDGHKLGLKFNSDYLKFQQATGTVDMRTGKVGGIFAQNDSIIVMGYGLFLFGIFTPEELAEMYTHELGHLVNGYYFIDQTKSFNYALRAVMDVVMSPMSDEQKSITMQHMDKHNILPNNSLTELIGKSPNAVRAHLTTERLRFIESEMNSFEYDSTTEEGLADNFVVRMGGGVHLIRALMKYESIGGGSNPLNRNRYIDYIKAAIRYLTGFGSVMTYPVALITGGFASLPLMFTISMGLLWALVSYFLVMVVVQLTENRKHYITASSFGDKFTPYDTPQTRISRIREAIVMAIRVQNLPDTTKAQMLKDINEIDTVLKQLGKRLALEDNIFFSMFTTAMQLSIKRESQEERMRELETLANNDLFIRAAELELLAKTKTRLPYLEKDN